MSQTVQTPKKPRAPRAPKPKADNAEAAQRNYISEALAKQISAKVHEKYKSEHAYVATPKQVQAALETFINYIIEQAVEGETVTITNFATFKRQWVPDKEHTNPQNSTLPKILKSAHYKMKVDVKPALKALMEKVPKGADS